MFRHLHIVVLAVAVALFGYGLYQWHATNSDIDRMSARSDDASIVRIDERKESESSRRKRHRETKTYYQPIIEFEDSDHVKHTAPSLHETSNGSLHLTGDEVSVMYDPQNADSGCVIVGEEEHARKEAQGKLFISIGVLVAGIAFSSVMMVTNKAYDKAGKEKETESETADET